MHLLISIADISEVPAAVHGGADIIDVKDPAAGALGAPAAEILGAIRTELGAGHVVSAALGDTTTTGGTLSLAAVGAAALGVRYVKLGLATDQVGQAITLLRRLQQSVRLVNPACGVIAVGYADATQIGALPWRSLPEMGQAAGIEGCMIDTAVKNGQTLFDHCDESALAAWLVECRQMGLRCALAGSLRLADLPAIRRLAPDIAGFRGAACSGDRVNGRVSAERVAALRAALQA
jgi:hypothetical protein